MNNVNSTQVQLTNDASTTSKCSAASKKYFKDNFIEHFVGKKKARASLINMGYYTRAVILFKLIEDYITFLKSQNVLKFQIVSCGSGFDTSYWRLSEQMLLSSDTVFIEIDFPSVIKKKISLINQSQFLKSYTANAWDKQSCLNINQFNDNYFLLEADLSNLSALELLFNKIKTDYNMPTLFVSECVITYMKGESSDQLIEWMAKKFKNSAFINYEQIHPNDGFGIVMLRHFDKLQSPLFSVEQYPDCASHLKRYKKLGFEKNFAVSEWDALIFLTNEIERQTAFHLELFDEFEEFHNKCVHYVIGVAGNQIGSKWIKSLLVNSNNAVKDQRKSLQVNHVSSNLELYRHSSFILDNKTIYVIGGCNKQRRSSKVFKINTTNNLNKETVQISENHKVQLDAVYGNVNNIELNGVQFCCLYGGRTSPNSVCNDGAIVILQILMDTLIPKLIIHDENLIPRYRSSMVSLSVKKNEVQIWIFGGRSADSFNSLSDLSRLDITLDEEETLKHRWMTYKKENENWPCNRMSHSMVACQKKMALFMSCGLKIDFSTVLNDLWKWCCRTETWEKLNLTGKILPRYGHTSHLIDNIMYLVGGVNTLAGLQPGLAKINLDELTAVEYCLQTSGPHPVLFFNHTSELIQNEENSEILILGGGGNCFSFGTYLNRGVQSIPLREIENNSTPNEFKTL